jgi:cysteinyl-tRNA synthetase
MLRLFNTLTRAQAPFAPGCDNTVRMYVCGPTVYARAHIGNFRTYVCVDVLRRALKHVGGHDMQMVVNYTDVDDKTINGANTAKQLLRDYTERWITAFREDAAVLGVETPEETPRATDTANMQAMGALVQRLEEKGYTYRSEGSVYFRIGSFTSYGALARLPKEGMQTGARVDVDEYSKDNARDFVLWKASKLGEPSWDVGAGPGRPGWHLECSAMALRLLGEAPIDIHAGGVDLIFPHHENEIAQSEGATGNPFARVWMHIEHLFVEGGKMSKSLGNVHTVEDVVARGYRPSALRFLLLSSHYRKQLNFTWAGMVQAEESIRRIVDCLTRLDDVRVAASGTLALAVHTARARFRSAIEDDLNTAAALAAIFDLIRDVNAAIDAGCVSGEDIDAVREVVGECDQVLGVVALRRAEDAQPPVPLVEIEALMAARQMARASRHFAEADLIREDLLARGIVLEDNAGVTRWKQR